MEKANVRSVLSPIFGVALLGAIASTSAVAAAPIAPEHIVAHGDYYIFEKAAIDDLNALETAVRAARPRQIALDGCGTDAARALKAAVLRFSDLPLQVQMLNATAATCTVAVARRVSQSGGQMPAGIDEAAVNQYWRQVAP